MYKIATSKKQDVPFWHLYM